MITDLFSHKIHSSGEEWPEKLIELAFIFDRFDGGKYDRAAIENELNQISPRSAYVARDRSKFRDEFSAYPAYFGLYRMEYLQGNWYIFMSETAKRYLLVEEPDVAAFLRLQMSLFQYPNGMGAAYYKNGGIRLQVNTATRTLEFIRAGVHLAPLRLIVAALIADASLRGVDLKDATVTFAEIFGLANAPAVNQTIRPSPRIVSSHLRQIRAGKLAPPTRFESRFHILGHLELFDVEQHSIKVRTPASVRDAATLASMLKAINSIDTQYSGFDTATTSRRIERLIQDGAWGRYFDAAATLPNELLEVLGAEFVGEHVVSAAPQLPLPITVPPALPPLVYPLRTRTDGLPETTTTPRPPQVTDPELTRIRRQRRNLDHKILLNRVDELLRSRGAVPQDSEHIDVYAKVPADGGFIFEVKSGGENLLDQIRKGLSQLYEYRFRYRNQLDAELHLCMVLPSKPEIPWIDEYLCVDRNISLCWFNSEGRIEYPNYCAEELSILQPS